jgi:hypothetical protein
MFRMSLFESGFHLVFCLSYSSLGHFIRALRFMIYFTCYSHGLKYSLLEFFYESCACVILFEIAPE